MKCFRTMVDEESEKKYALAIGGLPQFNGKPVVIDTYHTLEGLKFGYYEWARAGAGNKVENILLLEKPDQVTWAQVKQSEVKTLDKEIIEIEE